MVRDDSPRRPVGLLAALVLGSLLAALPLWLVTHPPMVDLPQHAAQLAIWQDWHRPDLDYPAVYEVNWFASQVVAPLLAHLVAEAFGVRVALKLVLSGVVVSLPWIALLLVREERGNPWWALAALPIGYGYAFFWGFFSFLVATPLALLGLVFVRRYLAEPGLRRGLGVLLWMHLLFFTHVLAFGFAGLVGGIWTLTGERRLGRALVRAWPLLAALVVPILWLTVVSRAPEMTEYQTILGLGWGRVRQLLTPEGGLLLLTPFAAGARPARDPRRWVPFGVALALFLFAPLQVMGTAFVYPRFAIFTVPCLLLALDLAPGGGWTRRLGNALPLVVAVLLLAVVCLRFLGFERDNRGFREVLAAMEPGHRTLYLAVRRGSPHFATPVYLHFGSWYQVEKGGAVDFSFASFFPNRFRYPERGRHGLPKDFEWKPLSFDWQAQGGGRYHYFLVRSERDLYPRFFGRFGAPVEAVAHSGMWWLYETVGDGSRKRDAKQLEVPDAADDRAPGGPDA